MLKQNTASKDIPEKDIILSRVELRGVISASCYWAWLYSVFFSDYLTVPAKETLLVNPQMCFLCGLSLGFLLTFFVSSKRQVLKPGALIAASLVGLLFAIVSLAGQLEAPLPDCALVALWVVSGAASAFAVISFGRMIVASPPYKSVLLLALSVSCGAFSNMVILLLPMPLATTITGLLLPLCTITAIQGMPLDAEAEKTRGGGKLPFNLCIMLFLYSVIYGLACFMSFNLLSLPMEKMLIGGAICCSGLLLSLLIKLFKVQINLSLSQFPLLAIAALSLLPLPFASNGVFFLCACVLIVAFCCFDVIILATLFENIRENDLPPDKTLSMGRFANTSGMAVGFFIGQIVRNTAENPQEGFVFVVGVFIAVIVVVLAYLGTQGNTFELPPLPNTAQTKDEADWDSAISALCQANKLSPRESEVFAYLARGYNAKSISDKLYISQNTAKSHLGRIYQKLGVRSQQEILNIVEESFRAEKSLRRGAVPASEAHPPRPKAPYRSR